MNNEITIDDKLSLYVLKAKKRIRELYSQTCGSCYLSFSGGKDSTVVLALIKECEKDGAFKPNSIPAVFCDTKIEMDATVEFVNWVKENYYDNVQVITTPTSFGKVLRDYGKPMLSKMKSDEIHRTQKNRKIDPTSISNAEKRLLNIGDRGRYHKIALGNKDMHILHKDFNIAVSAECCHQMKKIPFKTYAEENGMDGYLTGMRACEGGARQDNFEMRAKKYGTDNICTAIHGGMIEKSPLVDWTDDVLERFIEMYNVPLSRAYTEYGEKRTGCFLCPFSQQLKSDLETLYQKEPKKYKASLGFLEDVYIAQGIKLEFDEKYMAHFNEQFPVYERMRYEMLKQYRPNCRLAKKYEKEHGIESES